MCMNECGYPWNSGHLDLELPMIYILENELRNSAKAMHALNRCAISPASIFLTLLIWMNTFWSLAKISFHQLYFLSMLQHCHIYSNSTLSFSIIIWLHLSSLLSFYFVHHDILGIHTWILGHKLLEFDLRCQDPCSECYCLSGTRWQDDKNKKLSAIRWWTVKMFLYSIYISGLFCMYNFC